MKVRNLAAVLMTLLVPVSLLAQEAAPGLSLQNAVATYIENNLELQAARFSVERARADRVAARLRPNPGLSVTADNLPVHGPTAFGRLYEVGVTYSETIELGGKRSLRERTADATISAAEAHFEDTMRRGIAEVKRLYFSVLFARDNLALSIENRDTFNQLVQFNLVRFQEGAIPEVDLIKVRLERVKFDAAVTQAEVILRRTTIQLLETLGRTDISSTPVLSGGLTFAPLSSDPDSLRQFAVSDRADVRAAMAEVTAATERAALERARGTADISPFAGYKRVGNDDTLLFGVNIPLKVRDRNQAEVARAAADLSAAQSRLQLTRVRASAEVESAWAALQSATRLVEIFRSELLQQADEAQSIALAAYEEGGSDLLPVLEAQRTRSEVKREYLKTLFEYEASVVELELAAGREIRP